MTSEAQTLAMILYRNHKSIVTQMEKQLGCGSRPVEPDVERVYRGYVASVEKLERQLGK